MWHRLRRRRAAAAPRGRSWTRRSRALANVRHRGAVAADRRTGDGAGLLLPIPAGARAGAVVRSGAGLPPGRGGARGDRERLRAGGDRGRRLADGPGRPRCARRRPRARACRRSSSSSCCGRSALAARRGRAARLSRPPPRGAGPGRVRRLALVPHGHLQGALRGGPAGGVLPGPARRGRSRCRSRSSTSASRPTRARRGSARSPSGSSATTARSTRSTATCAQCAAARVEPGDEPAVLEESGSDSSLLDNALELLVRGGRDVRHAASMLLPRAWQEDQELDPDVAAFHSYHAGLVEPWDGPAAIVFTDGRVVGAALDRNGLRPLRVATAGAFVACASEAGAVPLDPSARVRRSRLGPGELLAVDPGLGFEEDATIAAGSRAARPYRRWLGDGRRTSRRASRSLRRTDDLTPRQLAAGYTREDLTLLLRPSAADGHEPTSSMGDDTALPPLAGRARPLFSYLRQRFAQVTNPPIDHLRERSLMSLRTLLGRRAPLLEPGAGGGAPDRARELLPLSLRRRRAARRFGSRRCSGRREPRPRPASDSPRRPRRSSTAERTSWCSRTRTAHDRDPGPARPRRRPAAAGRPRASARSSRSSSSATSRATAITSPACSATAPTPSARGSRSRRWRHSPPRTASAATTRRPARRSAASAPRSRTASSR